MNESRTQSTSPQSIRCLLVDDSEAQLEHLKLLLDRPEIEIITATTGQGALALCFGDHPDIILLDVEMPGMSGLDVAKILHDNAQTFHTPIIMVSSHREGELIEEAFAGGCSEYVVKPVNQREILAKIETLTGIRLLDTQ